MGPRRRRRGLRGALVAARLAARGTGTVLLLEAGPDQPRPRDRSHPLADAGRLVLAGFNWDYRANLRTSGRLEDLIKGGDGTGTPARALWERFPYQLGKVIGGGSAVNGAIALRGLPRDFATWAAQGNPDWSWERVLPFYRAIENDADFPGRLHGDSGPLPIRRTPRAHVHQLDAAFWEECNRQGVRDLPDLNAGDEAGVGPIPGNTVDGERIDADTAFLAGSRELPHLHVRPGVRVTRVLFDPKHRNRAVGVETERDGRLDTVRARNVILTAGAVGTPSSSSAPASATPPCWAPSASTRWPTCPAWAATWWTTRPSSSGPGPPTACAPRGCPGARSPPG